MTDGVLLRGSAIALGVAAFVSFAALSQAHADVITASQPSLNEPAPTPGWAGAGPQDDTQPTANERAATQVPATGHATGRRYVVHHPYRYAHRYYRNPITGVATGVVGGVADLGAAVTYPLYCFPDYGRCPVRAPYRF